MPATLTRSGTARDRLIVNCPKIAGQGEGAISQAHFARDLCRADAADTNISRSLTDTLALSNGNPHGDRFPLPLNAKVPSLLM